MKKSFLKPLWRDVFGCGLSIAMACQSVTGQQSSTKAAQKSQRPVTVADAIQMTVFGNPMYGGSSLKHRVAQFSPDGRSTTPASDTQPMPVARVANPLTSDIRGSIGDAYRGVLPPGAAMRFLGDTRLVSDLRSAYPIVRWTDHWNQRWEYKQGQVTRVSESDPWLP